MTAKRDFVGYGKKPPGFKWPGAARVALTIAVNYEAGGERSVINGDAGPETYGEFPSYGTPPKRDLTMESLFEYETRVGIWRLLRLFRRLNVKVTFFGVAKTLQVNPEAARQIVQDGHEICSHGYRWIEHFTLSKREEREHIEKAVAIIKEITGERPVGWYCREPGENTMELLVEEGGFLYNSDIYNDDLPYYTTVKGGKKLLLIPYTPDVNDFHYLSNRFPNAEGFYSYMRDTFDALYTEAGREGIKLMNVGVHVRITGRPGRAVALERFLRYAMGFPDVWIARRVDIAHWWLKNYKPD